MIIVGYGKNEIEPRIAPLVEAVQSAGFITFSSCEGHNDKEVFQRLGSVAFYAHENEAKYVHEVFLRYRGQLACSWCLRAGFVHRRETNQFTLGWTLENCGIIAQGDAAKFVTQTLKAGWNVDVPVLIEMFAEVGASRAGR